MPTDVPWPAWAERLPPDTRGQRRAEGGRRLASTRARQPDVPRVSYVTVVRNGEATLERTLESVRAQQWPEVEHVVLDGLSTDGTLALVQRHAASIDYFASEPDAGLYDALDKAIPLVTGDLICVLNADDWLTPDAAAIAAQAWLQGGRAPRELVATAAWARRGEGRTLWSPGALDAASVLRCADLCHNGVYATRGAYEASGPYGGGLRIAADFRWLTRCVDAGVAVRAVDRPTVHYSIGGLSNDVQRHTRECVQVLHERFPFLDEMQAWGLAHAFHLFASHMEPFADTRPPHLGRFLASVAQAHGERPDFARAFALASATVLQHPADDRPATRLTRGEKTRRSLHRRWMRLRALWKRD